MTKWKTILALCLAFALGAIAGGAFMMKRMEARAHDMASEGPKKLGELIVGRLNHKLKLTEGQRLKIERIINKNRDKIQVLHRELQPQAAQIMESAVADIRALLTPEQAEKFDALVAKNRPRWTHGREHEGR